MLARKGRRFESFPNRWLERRATMRKMCLFLRITQNFLDEIFPQVFFWEKPSRCHWYSLIEGVWNPEHKIFFIESIDQVSMSKYREHTNALTASNTPAPEKCPKRLERNTKVCETCLNTRHGCDLFQERRREGRECSIFRGKSLATSNLQAAHWTSSQVKSALKKHRRCQAGWSFDLHIEFDCLENPNFFCLIFPQTKEPALDCCNE